MVFKTFAAQTTESSSGILGFSLSTFVIQLITFVFVFLVLKRFAFKPIVKILEKRRQTIEDGVSLGEKMKIRESELEDEVKKTISEARLEADRIVDNAHKESRLILRKAETSARAKYDSIIKEAHDRIEEDTEHAQHKLRGNIAELVSEATEAVVHQKVNQSKDAAIIEEALKGQVK